MSILYNILIFPINFFIRKFLLKLYGIDVIIYIAIKYEINIKRLNYVWICAVVKGKSER